MLASNLFIFQSSRCDRSFLKKQTLPFGHLFLTEHVITSTGKRKHRENFGGITRGRLQSFRKLRDFWSCFNKKAWSSTSRSPLGQSSLVTISMLTMVCRTCSSSNVLEKRTSLIVLFVLPINMYRIQYRSCKEVTERLLCRNLAEE